MLICTHPYGFPAPSTPVKRQEKEKRMRRLIQPTHVYIPACVKAQDQENPSSGVAHSSQVGLANVYADSQVIASHENNKKSSAVTQIVMEPTVPRIE